MAAEDDPPSDWKLKLRYGQLQTPFSHYTLLYAGRLASEVEWSDSPAGPAILAMRVWASSHDEAFDFYAYVAGEVEFEPTERIELYDTDPEQPPREKPFAYGLNLTPFSE